MVPLAKPARQDPEAPFLAPPAAAGLHKFQMPTTAPPTSTQVLDQRSVSVLTALDNFLSYCRVPRKKTVAAGKLLTWAIQMDSQDIWTYTMSILMMHTATDGYRSEQGVAVLIAEKQAQARMEALTRLQSMGPKPAPEEQRGE